MGSFDDHLKAAIAVGILFTAFFLTKFVQSGVLTTLNEQFLFIGLTFGGIVVLGTALDVDVHSSIPRRALGKLLVVAAIAAPVYLLVTDPSILRGFGDWVILAIGLDSVSREAVGAVAVLVIALGAAKAAGIGIDELTTHRGIIHSKEFVAFCGILTFVMLSYLNVLPPIAVAIVALAFVVGGFVHLSVDITS